MTTVKPVNKNFKKLIFFLQTRRGRRRRPSPRDMRIGRYHLLLLGLLPRSCGAIALPGAARTAWGRAAGAWHHLLEPPPEQLAQSATLERLTNVRIPAADGREVLAFAARPAERVGSGPLLDARLSDDGRVVCFVWEDEVCCCCVACSFRNL